MDVRRKNTSSAVTAFDLPFSKHHAIQKSGYLAGKRVVFQTGIMYGCITIPPCIDKVVFMKESPRYF